MREALNIFKGNAARVLHVLMSEPGRRWHLVELADQAKVSPSTVHQVLFVLQNHLWVDARGLGPKRVRVLREPGALLEAWREEYSLKQYDARSFYGWAKSAEELRAAVTSAIDAAGVKYALTLASGAALVAPYATSVQTLSIIILAGADMDPVWTKAALEPAEDGANVTVMISKSDAPLLLRREIDGVWVASDVQLYLDLWVSPSRGKEQAEHLRRERLKY
jgi:DNA-binding MarR family transcriptional regulator